MRKLPVLFFAAATFLSSCKDQKKTPDVSGVQATTAVQRFDQDFFSIDTLNIDASLNQVHSKYPAFLSLYLESIIGITSPTEVKDFYRYYKPVFDSSQLIYRNFDSEQKEIEKAFKYVKYYFPNYITPKTILPVIGRMDSRNDLARMENGEYTPIFLGPGLVGISLQFYLGKQFSLYNDQYFINNVSPLYRSRRFSREYITSDVMKLIIDDMFPDKSSGRTLIDQMIEKGKHWWLLDKLMPEAADSIKTGYTAAQLEWCKENEGLNWTYIIKNENLHAVDPATIQTYIGEAPFTNVFSQELSPGNIGTWFGWQIIKKYEEKNTGIKPEEIMKASAAQILESAGYKPK